MKKNIKRLFKEKFGKVREAYKMGMGYFYKEDFRDKIKGEVFMTLTDLDGHILDQRHVDNLVVHDAGIYIARLFRDRNEPANGVNMLAIGTGAPGNLLNPDAPDKKYRKLSAEIARKTFADTAFRDSAGNKVAYPTRILDLTTIFGEGEAVGPLNEMGLMSTISASPAVTNPNPQSFPNYDPALDISTYDNLLNLLHFGVVTKPSQGVLTITWRLTFG